MHASPFPVLNAHEAAHLIPDNGFVGFSGFTAAGSPKAVPGALAERAQAMHDAGEPMRIRVIAGASTGDALDERLARAHAIAWRAPYQSSPTLRKQINAGEVEFVEMHLSHVGQTLEFGFLGELDVAVVEATDVTPDGRVYLTASSGITPSILRHAKRVIVEVNRHHSTRLAEMHDVAVLPPPPKRNPIPIHHPMDKVGVPFAQVDPSRVVGVVETDGPDGTRAYRAPDATSERIAEHLTAFLVDEVRAGRVPAEFLPLQAGVGNVANAVLAGLGACPDIPPFYMYTEVLQDGQIEMLRSCKLLGASTSSLTLNDALLRSVYDDMGFFAPRIVLRPTEFSNNPGVVRRLGVIAINTVLEMDLTGCANSTHVAGTGIMNGIGGSGDFVRNAYLSVLVAPSVVKGGNVSTVVPLCSHVDHNEHSVQVLVTEQGLADLRGLAPRARAERIVERCAHPAYRDELRRYLRDAKSGHLPQDLAKAFGMHRRLAETGSMHPDGVPAPI